ncbi:hypothetical protein [Streptomyces sp. LN699]|uniref:hypothetical protein n=1 Tax=Streptomyces sp. LN699 TaxID=3112981 RepID=UPI00370FDDBE
MDAPVVAGVAGGVAVLGFGGLYVAGLLLTGSDIAAGTKVRGPGRTASSTAP